MKRYLQAIASAILMTASIAAMAAPGLTSQECNDYPFVQPAGALTHAQIMQNLKELEDLGYWPTRIDPFYPRRLERAEKKLQVEYRRDCMHGNRGANING
jgi:hypothetical protein